MAEQEGFTLFLIFQGSVQLKPELDDVCSAASFSVSSWNWATMEFLFFPYCPLSSRKPFLSNLSVLSSGTKSNTQGRNRKKKGVKRAKMNFLYTHSRQSIFIWLLKWCQVTNANTIERFYLLITNSLINYQHFLHSPLQNLVLHESE